MQKYVEVKILEGDRSPSSPILGFFGALVHNRRLDLNKRHVMHYNSNKGVYFMSLYNGGLFGSGKTDSDSQGVGCLQIGDRIGTLVKAGPKGYVRFYRNGELFGSSFSGPITALLTIVVNLYGNGGVSLQLLSVNTPHTA